MIVTGHEETFWGGVNAELVFRGLFRGINCFVKVSSGYIDLFSRISWFSLGTKDLNKEIALI